MNIFSTIIVHHINFILSIFGLFLAISLGIFLFWRAGRRELVESQTLFDFVTVFLVGALLFGRLFDFAVRYDFYHLSVKKLIFFNAYGGFDFYGALFGGILFVWFYIRNKKDKFWFTFDLGAAPVVFGALVYLFAKFIILLIAKNGLWNEYLYYVCGYFIIFWALKKFELKKKHDGFFASFFIISSAILNIGINALFFSKLPLTIFYYHLIFSLLLGIIASVNWYLLAKRKINKDIKGVFGGTLLLIFKIKRVITNVREADNTAKAIILSPLYLVKWLYFLVKYLVLEFVSSLFDLGHTFRLKK
jgi:hypothetical protein